MTTVRPFFLLLGRASVFWLGAFALLCGAMIVAGAVDRETPADRYLDAAFIATVWFPAAAGWLAGLIIQEFQHTTFAFPLPGVRSRLRAGYVGTGLVVALVVSGVIALSGASSWSLPLLFVVCLGAFCVGGALQDPLSNWVTWTYIFLVIFVMATSQHFAGLAGEHPWITAAVALAVGAAGVRRLFARSTFRLKPFRLTKPVPGSFSLQKSDSYARRRMLGDGPRTTGWRAGYIGGNPWGWVRAAIHETHGAMGWKRLARSIGNLWALGFLVLIYAWADKGELSFAEAIGRSLYDALFDSPHVAEFGEKGGPYGLVMIVIAAAGIVTAMFRCVTLHEAVAYPLSRLQRARVAFRSGLVDMGFLVLVLGLGFYAVGHLTGLLVGYEAHFDFMPFHIRVLLVTLVLIPLGYWGRLRLHEAARHKASNMLVAVSFGVVGFVLLVGACAYLSPRILVFPAAELVVLIGMLVISQLTYRSKLRSYYRTADLA